MLCWATLCCAVVQVEASIQEALSGMSQGLASLEQQMGEAGSSEAQLNARLEKLTGASPGCQVGKGTRGTVCCQAWHLV
jgi:hypothetical protein